MGNGLAFGTAVGLDPALKYLVHVHDPSYFIPAFTPLVPTGLMLWLETTQTRLISIESQPKKIVVVVVIGVVVVVIHVVVVVISVVDPRNIPLKFG